MGRIIDFTFGQSLTPITDELAYFETKGLYQHLHF